MKNQNLVNIKDLAEILKKPESTIYGLVHLKKIPHYKVGHSLRFDISEVLQSFKKGGKKRQNVERIHRDSLKFEDEKLSHEFSPKEDLWQK